MDYKKLTFAFALLAMVLMALPVMAIQGEVVPPPAEVPDGIDFYWAEVNGTGTYQSTKMEVANSFDYNYLHVMTDLYEIHGWETWDVEFQIWNDNTDASAFVMDNGVATFLNPVAGSAEYYIYMTVNDMAVMDPGNYTFSWFFRFTDDADPGSIPGTTRAVTTTTDGDAQLQVTQAPQIDIYPLGGSNADDLMFMHQMGIDPEPIQLQVPLRVENTGNAVLTDIDFHLPYDDRWEESDGTPSSLMIEDDGATNFEVQVQGTWYPWPVGTTLSVPLTVALGPAATLNVQMRQYNGEAELGNDFDMYYTRFEATAYKADGTPSNTPMIEAYYDYYAGDFAYTLSYSSGTYLDFGTMGAGQVNVETSNYGIVTADAGNAYDTDFVKLYVINDFTDTADPTDLELAGNGDLLISTDSGATWVPHAISLVGTGQTINIPMAPGTTDFWFKLRIDTIPVTTPEDTYFLHFRLAMTGNPVYIIEDIAGGVYYQQMEIGIHDMDSTDTYWGMDFEDIQAEEGEESRIMRFTPKHGITSWMDFEKVTYAGEPSNPSNSGLQYPPMETDGGMNTYGIKDRWLPGTEHHLPQAVGLSWMEIMMYTPTYQGFSFGVRENGVQIVDFSETGCDYVEPLVHPLDREIWSWDDDSAYDIPEFEITPGNTYTMWTNTSGQPYSYSTEDPELGITWELPWEEDTWHHAEHALGRPWSHNLTLVDTGYDDFAIAVWEFEYLEYVPPVDISITPTTFNETGVETDSFLVGDEVYIGYETVFPSGVFMTVNYEITDEDDTLVEYGAFTTEMLDGVTAFTLPEAQRKSFTFDDPGTYTYDVTVEGPLGATDVYEGSTSFTVSNATDDPTPWYEDLGFLDGIDSETIVVIAGVMSILTSIIIIIIALSKKGKKGSRGGSYGAFLAFLMVGAIMASAVAIPSQADLAEGEGLVITPIIYDEDGEILTDEIEVQVNHQFTVGANLDYDDLVTEGYLWISVAGPMENQYKMFDAIGDEDASDDPEDYDFYYEVHNISYENLTEAGFHEEIDGDWTLPYNMSINHTVNRTGTYSISVSYADEHGNDHVEEEIRIQVVEESYGNRLKAWLAGLDSGDYALAGGVAFFAFGCIIFYVVVDLDVIIKKRKKNNKGPYGFLALLLVGALVLPTLATPADANMIADIRQNFDGDDEFFLYYWDGGAMVEEVKDIVGDSTMINQEDRLDIINPDIVGTSVGLFPPPEDDPDPLPPGQTGEDGLWVPPLMGEENYMMLKQTLEMLWPYTANSAHMSYAAAGNDGGGYGIGGDPVIIGSWTDDPLKDYSLVGLTGMLIVMNNSMNADLPEWRDTLAPGESADILDYVAEWDMPEIDELNGTQPWSTYQGFQIFAQGWGRSNNRLLEEWYTWNGLSVAASNTVYEDPITMASMMQSRNALYRDGIEEFLAFNHARAMQETEYQAFEDDTITITGSAEDVAKFFDAWSDRVEEDEENFGYDVWEEDSQAIKREARLLQRGFLMDPGIIQTLKDTWLALIQGEFTVTVVDHEGNPVEGVSMNLTSLDRPYRTSGTTNENGKLTMSLPIGGYKIEAQEDGVNYTAPGSVYFLQATGATIVLVEPDSNWEEYAMYVLIAVAGMMLLLGLVLVYKQGRLNKILPRRLRVKPSKRWNRIRPRRYRTKGGA